MSTMQPLTTVPRSRRERQERACCPMVTPAQLGDEEVRALAERFKALGDPTRLRILGLLAANEGGVCVCDLNDDFELEQPTISHHLKVLRRAGLARSERRGNWAYYSLHPSTEEWVRQTLAAAPR